MYDSNNLVEELDGSGAVAARYTFGQRVDEPLAQLRSGTTSYYQGDGLDSVTSLTSGSATTLATYVYDTFGNLSASTGSLTNPFRYTGRDFDSETSLSYYRARYYSPQSGHFLSEDPIRLAGGINYYAYNLNRPTDLTDPFGTKGGSWSQSVSDTASMFWNWLRGTGPSQLNFGANSVQVQDLMNAPGVRKARQFFYCKNSNDGPLQPVSDYDAGFGLKGAWQAGLNPTQQFVGNYTVDIFPNEDGTATFTVFNTTSFTSFFYGLGPDWERTNDNPYMGNMRQTYYWTEPIPDLKGRECGCNKK